MRIRAGYNFNIKTMNKKRPFSIEEISKFLNSRKKPYEATLVQVLDYWDKKDWLTLKGEKVATIAAAVNVVNSHVIQLKRKELAPSSKLKVEEKDRSNEWCNKRSPYLSQLTTPQWKAYREFILAVRGRKCESCGKPSNLHIHHREYFKNRHAWEYLPNEVMVVCGDCHRHIHNIKR